jgi:hypothetical protein
MRVIGSKLGVHIVARYDQAHERRSSRTQKIQ